MKTYRNITKWKTALHQKHDWFSSNRVKKSQAQLFMFKFVKQANVCSIKFSGCSQTSFKKYWQKLLYLEFHVKFTAINLVHYPLLQGHYLHAQQNKIGHSIANWHYIFYKECLTSIYCTFMWCLFFRRFQILKYIFMQGRSIWRTITWYTINTLKKNQLHL